MHFDYDGVPVLQGDEIKPPRGPTLADLARAARRMPRIPDIRSKISSEETRAILQNEYPEYLAARMNRPAVEDDSG